MNIFARTERLIGADGLARLAAARVILFGTGGVGSWCAEALIRSGIGHLTMVDPDCVDETNINRQLPATTATVGQPKVEVLRNRLLEINPEADITALRQRYEKGVDFGLSQYDVIIDAIDSLTDKMNLLLEASATPAQVFCSLGAACKLDPTKIKVAEFFSVRGCPLGAALRKKMRKENTLPAKPITAVYDEEVLPNRGPEQDPGPGKAIANGTLAHITGIFGFTLAGLVIEHILVS
ncbi:MAG: tRNA threonylcarbamoyladenosine dehydratase [Bacteroidales bacterium]|jgi:tRNA A37 threonylcarbamoyladenosine dehydratase|nr:tRNA threonylcarbamoyladenosine dehydratase [Bacteroidales bacterium]